MRRSHNHCGLFLIGRRKNPPEDHSPDNPGHRAPTILRAPVIPSYVNRSGPSTTAEAMAVYTADDLARLLHLNVKSVREAARTGEIPVRRVGRRLIFPVTAIDAWLAEASATMSGPASRRRKRTTR